MKIKLDNLDGEDGMVTITCDDRQAAIDDQSIEGSLWEAPSDMNVAYAVVCDRPSLTADLEKEGYELDVDEYSPPG